MSDIFISYSRADRDRAHRLAQALGERGFDVWWDRKIPPGKSFDQVIQEALDAARCVVVLWSKTSVTSNWVKEEASSGMAKGALVPARLDDVAIPLGFRRIQAAKLVDWHGELDHPEFEHMVRSVATFVGGRIDTGSFTLVRTEEPERDPEPAPPAPARAPAPPPAPSAVARPVRGPVPDPAPARGTGRSRASGSRRLPLAAALAAVGAAVVVLSVAGIAWNARRGDAGPATVVDVETVAEPVAEPGPSAPAEPGAVDDGPDAAGAPEGLPPPAEVVPASGGGEDAEPPRRTGRPPHPSPTVSDTEALERTLGGLVAETPEEPEKHAEPPPERSPAGPPDDELGRLLRRAASPELPLHLRRNLLDAYAGSLDDERARFRVAKALATIRDEMEFSASIIEEKNFVVASRLLYDASGVANGATGVRDAFPPGAVHLFARVRAPKSGRLRLEWRERSGRVLKREAVEVGRDTDPGYRIGHSHTFTEPGRYEVRLYNGAGTLIGQRRFEITGA